MYLFLLLITNVPYILSQSLSAGITNLAMELSSRIENSGEKNFVLSPYSAHSAFSQVLLGSQSNTKSQLESVLGIGAESTSEYARLKNSLRSGGATVKVANLMALAKGFKPRSKYTQDIRSRFGSELKELEFADITQRANSVKQVNDFVSSATNGKIEDLLSEDQVDALTRLLLINAVYFKALWKTSFRKQDTFPTAFRTPSGSVQADYMNAELKVRVKDAGNYEILELPYTDQNKALLVVLPKNGVSSDNIIQNIRNVNLNDIRNEKPEDTVVTLPRFKIRDRTFLKSIMQSMGLTALFGGSADLSGIGPNLYVSDAVQDAFIEVNEEGTEAAAATAVIIGLRTARRKKQFFADRPFVFMVYDFQEGIPLFLGKVVNPGTSGSVALRSGPGVVGQEVFEQAGKTTPSVNTEACRRYLEDYPNAHENMNLCRMAEQMKQFDWLTSFRTVCEKSQSLLNSFESNNCESSWCLHAESRHPQWTRDYARLCEGNDPESPVQCRQLSNQISSYSQLSCGQGL